jgi:GTPase SAR1 family protein
LFGEFNAMAQVDAIVYLVDAADRDRFTESHRELSGLLLDDGLAGVPFLILGNKIDLPYAGSALLLQQLQQLQLLRMVIVHVWALHSPG